MPMATRLGDVCTGHGCFPPRPSVAGSPNVLVNNIPIVRVGDMYAPHGCPTCPPHPAPLAAGSSTVLVNNMPAGRMGDAVGCGSSAMACSANVSIGG